MVSIDADTNVFLMPASSAEDQKLIDKALGDPGLEWTDIEPNLKDETSLENDIQQLEESIDDAKAHLETLDNRTESNSNNTEEERRFELERELEGNRRRLSTKKKELTESGKILENAQEEFSNLQQKANGSDDEPVQCWPVSRRLGEQYSFSAGDLLLFYTGNELYSYAATIERPSEPKSLETLGRVLLDDDDRSRSLFLILSKVYPIQVKSSVIAKITGRELESVQQVSLMGSDARNELARRFGDLESFIEDGRSGIDFLPPEPSSNETHDWTIGDPDKGSVAKSTATGDSKSGGTHIDPDRRPTLNEETATSVEGPDELPAIENPELTRPRDWQSLAETLEREKQVVLVGPQGTGKRQAVERLLSEWLNEEGRLPPDERVLRTQFTPDTDYDKFVLGQFNDDPGSEQLVTGPFGQFVDLAAAAETQFVSQSGAAPPKYVVIIEGFQTADPARVFGEFWQSLRPQNRGSDNPVRVSGTAATLWLPDNLYIIGIDDANEKTAHGGLELAGSPFAIRRTHPDYATLRETYGYEDESLAKAAQDDAFDALSILALEQLNARIRDATYLDDGHVFGHEFLIHNSQGLEPFEKVGLYRTWQYEILPALAGCHNEGLSGLAEELFSDISFATDDRHLESGAVDSNPELVRELVEALATAHSDY